MTFYSVLILIWGGEIAPTTKEQSFASYVIVVLG